MKKGKGLALLMLLSLLLTSCRQNPSEEQLFAKLTACFEGYGFTCERMAMEEERAAPIYKASVWRKLMLDGEEVLVYFDESNRADYLSGQIAEEWGQIGHFGLRFVLVYQGHDARVQEAIAQMSRE